LTTIYPVFTASFFLYIGICVRVQLGSASIYNLAARPMCLSILTLGDK
jgi:hypothetical protein